MKLTFGGHNFWIIQLEDKTIYFDPILVDGLGVKADGGRIFPPRKLDLLNVPQPDYVIITHEHTDHFHIPSLKLISKKCVIVFGLLMPTFIENVLINLGFKQIKRVGLSKIFQIGPFKLTFYNSAKNTAFWEQRVTQILLHFEKYEENHSIFFSVDAAMSTYFVDDLKRGKIKLPKTIILSNNSEIPSDLSITGSLDDCRPSKIVKDRAFINLKIFQELFVNYIDQISEIKYVFVVGGGFVKQDFQYSEQDVQRQKMLETVGNYLSLSENIFAPFPGDEFIDSKDGYILDKCKFIQLIAKTPPNNISIEKFGDFHLPSHTFNCISNLIEEEDAIKQLGDYLPRLARALLMSKQGRDIVSMNEYNGYRLSGKRIAIVFILQHSKEKYFQVALDIQKSEFVNDDTNISKLTEKYPSGLFIHLCDWKAVINGRIQIWDIATNLRSWYPHDNPFMSLVAFLYIHLGEQLRPDLAYKALLETIPVNS
jgi:Beta-lactamase superfamily domain